MKKKKLYLWASDFSDSTGEGQLARLFALYLRGKGNKIHLINKINQNNLLDHKYISPFIGIFYCWKFYLRDKKVAYINYLPLWNFIIFIFLPPNTTIGPITGGALFNNKKLLNYFIRKYLFTILYKISEFFLKVRSFNKIFSTDLLKQHLSKEIIEESEFNFVFKSFSPKKKNKKKLDFLIYYRKHKNKEIFFPLNFIKKLIRYGFKIHIIGDTLNISAVKNYGILTHKEVSKLQSISKYTIVSGENPYSFFIIECLSNHMKIIINKKERNKIKFNKEKFIELDFNKGSDFKKLKIIIKK